MLLSELLNNPSLPKIEITNLSSSTKYITPGTLFIAEKGQKFHAIKFVKDAIEKGAVAIIAEQGSETDLTEDAKQIIKQKNIPLIYSENLLQQTSEIASIFYNKKPSVICTITGTNGKTSTADFLKQMWHLLNYKSASIGTMGVVPTETNIPKEDLKYKFGSLTTPHPIDMHKILNTLKINQTDHVIIEATSVGIVRHRLDNLNITAAAFTNLTPEHLDFHNTVENYSNAKLDLFKKLLSQNGTAIINADDHFAETIIDTCKSRNIKTITYGEKGQDIKLINFIPNHNGAELETQILGHNYKLHISLIGKFQTMNILCALGLLIASTENWREIIPLLNQIKNAEGRLEFVGQTKLGANIFVDYAHEGESLKTILTTLKPHTPGRLTAVIGAGGNKPKDRRTSLGKSAEQFADIAIITDDNPRWEDPADIRAGILKHCPKGIEIPGRKEAIEYAINNSKEGDTIVICGKGHESGIIIKDKTYPFNDKEEIQKILKSQG